MALTAAQRAVIMTGSRPAWATGMNMAWDFTTNRTWTANPITDTHSAAIYAQYQNGSFAPFAANTLVRTDLGLQTVPTRTNLFLNSLAPATQSITVVSTTQYTVAVYGSGSVTLSGAGTGTATVGSPVTFTASTTSLTVTVSGSPFCVNVTTGAFAVAPIATTGTSATVNGNQQVVDLTGRLSAGLGLIMQFNPLDVTATFKQPISFNDGTANNYLNVYMDVGGGTPLSQIVNATINQGNVTMPGANATGVQTWVIAAGPNYHRTQKIGQAASTTDTTVSWPTTLSKMNIGGNGYSAVDNMYQLTRRLALRFGAANDAMFNDLVAKATLLAAVS